MATVDYVYLMPEQAAPFMDGHVVEMVVYILVDHTRDEVRVEALKRNTYKSAHAEFIWLRGVDPSHRRCLFAMDRLNCVKCERGKNHRRCCQCVGQRFFEIHHL